MARIVCIFAILALAPPIAGQHIPDGCNEKMTVQGCFDHLKGKKKSELETAATTLKSKSVDAAREVATAALSAGGTPEAASSTWDAISTLFGSLALGTSERSSDSLTLNFNTDKLLRPGNPLTARVTIRKAAILDALLSAQSEANRPALRERWEKQLGDLDDVEYTLAWSRSKRNESLAQNVLSEIAGQVFAKTLSFASIEDVNMAEVLQQAEETVKRNFNNQNNDPEKQEKNAKDVTVWTLSQFKENMTPPEYQLLLAQIERAADQSVQRLKEYIDKFPVETAELLAKLASNEGQFRVALTSRRRSSLVGPDENSGSLTWEIGAVTLSEAKNKCNKGTEAECLLGFLQDQKKRIREGRRFTLSVEYGKSRALRFSDTGATSFSMTPAKRITGRAVYGRNVQTDSVTHAVKTRLEVECKYDDVSGDEKRNSRLVATASLAQALTDGSVITLSLVYANKPEYRGEVQEELSARLGVKWSVGKK